MRVKEKERINYIILNHNADYKQMSLLKLL